MIDIKVIDFINKSLSLDKFEIDNDTPQANSLKSLAYVLNWQLSKKRSGTAQTKIMSEISGTTAKPHKQKGTGHARQGSKRSVQFRGGRTCFGPRFRSFGYKIPKKIIKIGLKEAIKLKIKENKLVLFDNFFSNNKTSSVSKVIKEYALNKSLIIFDSNDAKLTQNILISVRNIKNVKAIDFKAINVYDLLRFNFIILDKKLVSKIKEVIL